MPPVLYATVYKEACAHHDEGIIFRKMEPDLFEIQCKEEIFEGPDAPVEICELGAKPAEPVMDAAPTEQETVEQLHSLSQEPKALCVFLAC